LSFNEVHYLRRPVKSNEKSDKPKAINEAEITAKEDPVDLCFSFSVLSTCSDFDMSKLSEKVTI
jgi:hypothetical protein